jgi:hypothetical protein
MIWLLSKPQTGGHMEQKTGLSGRTFQSKGFVYASKTNNSHYDDKEITAVQSQGRACGKQNKQ